MILEGGYEDKHLQFSSIQNVDTGKTFDIFILYIIYSNKSKMHGQTRGKGSKGIFFRLLHIKYTPMNENVPKTYRM